MPTESQDLLQDFAEELDALIRGCIPLSDDVKIGLFFGTKNRVVIQPMSPSGEERKIPLFLASDLAGEFDLHIQVQIDPAQKTLRTVKSNFVLSSTLEDEPLARLEFYEKTRSAPITHWQFHAERGAFSFLLGVAAGSSKLVTDQPWRLSKLHFPVGGDRYRPGVEDFLEFLIFECGFDKHRGWQKHLQKGRTRQRDAQLEKVIRAQQNKSAQILTDLGWQVSFPGDLPSDLKTSSKW